MATLKALALKEDLLTAGHTLCPGCGVPVVLKMVLRAARYPLVISNATGCLQRSSTCFPLTSWKVNWLHSSGGDAAATMSGILAMYRSLKRRGKLGSEKQRKFLVIGGDGSTYDMGIGALSGALERGDDFVYLCYDNQVCDAAGGYSSSATPMGAATITTPAGKVLPGKLHKRKAIINITASHHTPYVAQASPFLWQDLYRKAEKAFETNGPAFLTVLSPCPPVWKSTTDISFELTRLAADTCVWPIYEIRNGHELTINYKPKQKLPVTEWFKPQARFHHLLQPENKWIVDKIQHEVDKEWELLLSSEKDNHINQ